MDELLDQIDGSHDEPIIRFSLETARTKAWRFAAELAPLAVDHRAVLVAALKHNDRR